MQFKMRLRYSTGITTSAQSFYYKQGSEIKQKSWIFLSESKKHNTSAVFTIQKQLIDNLKKIVKNVCKIIYITNGAKQHFKNM